MGELSDYDKVGFEKQIGRSNESLFRCLKYFNSQVLLVTKTDVKNSSGSNITHLSTCSAICIYDSLAEGLMCVSSRKNKN